MGAYFLAAYVFYPRELNKNSHIMRLGFIRKIIVSGIHIAPGYTHTAYHELNSMVLSVSSYQILHSLLAIQGM